MKFNHLFFLLQFSFFLMGHVLFSQESTPFLHVTQDSLEAGNGELVGTTLKLVNLGDQRFDGKLIINAHSFLRVIGKPTETVEIAANDSLFVSLRALVSQSAKAGKEYGISARLYDADSRLIARQEIAVSIAETKNVRLLVRDRQVALHDQGGFFELTAQLHNEGNTPQEVVVVTTLPNELQGDIPDQNTYKLKAFQDTTIVLRKRITRDMMRLDNFTIHLTGLYKRGNVFGRETVSVNAIKASRRFRPPGMGLYPERENLFSFRAQSVGEENSVYQSRLNTHFDLDENAEITMNIDGTWRRNVDQLYFRNTYVAYRSDRFGAQLGNIYENKAVFLQGRGVKGFYSTKNQKNRIEIGAVENSYRLFDSSRETPGKSFWATYAFQKNPENTNNEYHQFDESLSSTFIYDEDFYQNEKNMLLAFHGILIDTTNLEMKGGIYGGTTTPFKEIGGRKYGVAAELTLRATIGKFSFGSDNFVSTGYYPGRRRGALNFNEHIHLGLEKYRLWASYNHYSYRPNYQLRSQGSENKFGNTRASLGASRKIGRFFVSLSPKYSLEERELSYLDDTQAQSLAAIRMGTGINYRSPDYRHSFFLDTEIGFSDAHSTGFDTFQFLGSFNYDWGIFHFNASYQIGAFYLGESLYLQNGSNNEKYERWYVQPNIRYHFFNNKLQLTAGLNYSHNSNAGESLQLVGRANYALPYGIEVFVGTEYYDYSYGDYSDQRVEFGIIKHFSMPKFGVNNNSLHVFVYKETDGVEGYTEADEVAVHQLIEIGGIVFSTNRNGMIEYKKLPEGSYGIKFKGNNGWYAKDREVYAKGEVEIQIGLEKMTTVKGSIGYSSTILSYDINQRLDGLKVLAIDASGKTYSTRTTSDGKFIFYVPKGNYTISLITPGIMEYVNVIDNNQTIKTTQEQSTKVYFNIAVKEKQVEYKKFTSN